MKIMITRRKWLLIGGAILALIVMGVLGNRINREREIYVALHQAGMWAIEKAESGFSFSRLGSDAEANQRLLALRRKYYERYKSIGRDSVAVQYGISYAERDAILKRGDEENWPVWDRPFVFRRPAGSGAR